MSEQPPINTSRDRGARPSQGSVHTRSRALLTMREAADYLSVSYWTIRTWVDKGKLRAVRLPGDGRLVRIEVDELDRLIEECRDN